MTLVSVPYQPGYKATPDTVAMLMRASAIAGHDITLVDAWRPYAEQAYYYDQYINHGGNVASNPDTGQRNHMRGAAFDILNTSAVNRNAMLAAGFTPDPDEPWHFNNPNWQNMSIIPVDTPGVAPKSKKDKVVKQYHYQHRPSVGRPMEPGVRLRMLLGSTNRAQNIVGAVGPAYSITTHFYAEGFAEGDTVNIWLVWSNKGKESTHYVVTLIADSEGKIRGGSEFKRRVISGDSVFFDCMAGKDNKKTGKVTVMDTDAYSFDTV